MHDWCLAREFWDNHRITKINLKDIDISDICFAFGDSYVDFKSNPPFLKDKLMEYISQQGNIENFLESIQNGKIFMIEAHLWTDKYFKQSGGNRK